jgi:hypothetical protein
MAAHRGIATLAAALMVCFLLLSAMEPEFALLHFYQSLIYLVILLMLFYFEERWAYMIGILTGTVWLVLAFGAGMLGGALQQVSRLVRAERPTSEISVMVGVIAVLAALLIVFCAYRWKREFAGLGKGLSTFLVSFAVVAGFYAILIAWFWHMVTQAIPV